MNTSIIVAGVDIVIDEKGRLNLNDLHTASGGENKNRPSIWAELEKTKALIATLLESDETLDPSVLSIVKGGSNPGTFAHELLAISYASWISPEFQLQVNRVFLAYRRGELVHSSTPPELRTRLDSLVEAKAKGLISGHRASEMAYEAIRSNWHKLPALPAGDTDTMPIFQVLLRTQVKVSGAAFIEPRMMTVYEAAITAKDGEYGAEECLHALNRIGVDLHDGHLAINPGSQELCDLLRLRGPSVLKDALLTERGMVVSKARAMVGSTPCTPLLIPLSSL